MTDFRLKTVFLALKLYLAIFQPLLELGLHLWTQCASALGVEHFGGVKNFWLRMTDFGLKNYVIDVKTLSDHNSAPFL